MGDTARADSEDGSVHFREGSATGGNALDTLGALSAATETATANGQKALGPLAAAEQDILACWRSLG